ncbi:MAG: excinuclease ABC subunit UvrA [Candidatus Blackburnbacteria bacterium]|nr:excinuclease ABC subunit UvrA [Candidatus Blackburnbacteria bacterium]
MQDKIVIRGAREHNLKNIDVEIPKNKLVVFTGISGSGKSSLAFDTIYAEGQRRYVESLSAYARQFLGIMNKPDVDTIEGLSPAISIEQKTTSHNPRSTVGTATEIYDYLRLLFARIGHPHCPICGKEIVQQSVETITRSVLQSIKEALATKQVAKFIVFSPVVRGKKGEFTNLFSNLLAKGYTRVRVDNRMFGLDEDLFLIKTNKHDIDVVVDRIAVEKKQIRDQVALDNLRSRLSTSIEQGLALSDGLVMLSEVLDAGFDIPDNPKNLQDHLYSERFTCPVDNLSFPEIEPRTFSFNSPHGACPTCSGIGTLLKIDPTRIFNPELTIAEGGILPMSNMFENDTWYSRIIKTVVEANGFSVQVPIKNLTIEQRKILLEGTGSQIYRVRGPNRERRMTTILEKFPGIVRELERRHSETESEYVRREIEKYMIEQVCPDCKGARLMPEALSITIANHSIVDVTRKQITDALGFIESLSGSDTHSADSIDSLQAGSGQASLTRREQEIARLILREIFSRLRFLVSVGLEYLTLDRASGTLAGGEAQRIRLASQIGSGLTGVLYVLDEPTIGLHQRDNRRLIKTLQDLRDLGNTVIVVEHDREMMESADWILDFGPGAGKAGGDVVAEGSLEVLQKNPNSVTSKYLLGKKDLWVNKNNHVTMLEDQAVTLHGVNVHNLKNLTASFPLHKFVCITGVSGSGKSTLLVDTLYPALKKAIDPPRLFSSVGSNSSWERLEGADSIRRLALLDQSPIGRTPRSNPVTYTGVFTDIRDLFAQAPEARVRGYKQGRFSFNVKGGRCEACEGQGVNKIEMHFLSDVYVTCDICEVTRYNRETLEVEWHGKNIADVLKMTVAEAQEFFANIPSISDKLQTLSDVGLDYIELGQSAPTLSGGEAQRIKLSTELMKRSGGSTFYILDEPTTGLHFQDIEKLLGCLLRLVEMGNTVVVIEHNLDVIKNADWVVDLGPEGGEKGGEIIAQGTPKDIAKVKSSYTGQFLAKIL